MSYVRRIREVKRTETNRHPRFEFRRNKQDKISRHRQLIKRIVFHNHMLIKVKWPMERGREETKNNLLRHAHASPSTLLRFPAH